MTNFQASLHMGLCILKIFALVVIAHSLWKMTNAYGYMENWGPNRNFELSDSVVGRGTFRNPGTELPVFHDLGQLDNFLADADNKRKAGIVLYEDVFKTTGKSMTELLKDRADRDKFDTPTRERLQNLQVVGSDGLTGDLSSQFRGATMVGGMGYMTSETLNPYGMR